MKHMFDWGKNLQHGKECNDAGKNKKWNTAQRSPHTEDMFLLNTEKQNTN